MRENKRNGRIEKLSRFVMKIKGIQKTTLIDFPGKIACTLFLFGCNFRCGFCHNPELVVREESEDLNQKEILDFLEKRKKQLDGVCITGGEPLFSLDKEFVKKIKDKGYLIKIDTNGSFPEKLKEFIDDNLVDYIAMDLKIGRESYSEIAMVKVDLNKIEESIKLIINSDLDYEFRTTIVPNIHDEEKIENIGKWILNLIGKKPKKYYLQGFVNNGKFNDEKFKNEKDFSFAELKTLQEVAKKYFENVGIRGQK